MSPRALFSSVLTLVLGVVWGPIASAQIPVGSDIRVDTSAAGVPGLTGPSRVTSLAPDGGFVVAWTTAPFPPGGYDIAARRFNAAGVAVGAELRVNAHTTDRQDHPSIASDVAGNFVVVWTSDGQDGGAAGVFGQRFDASGARLGAEFRANDTTLNAQRSPSVAMAPGGDFVVVWTSAPGYEIFARRYDFSGAPVGGEFQVNAYTTGSANAPSVDFDASGNFVVVWDSFYVTESRIRGQLFAAGGAPQGSEFLVDTGTAPATRPRVGRGRNGEFVVAWFGSEFGPSDIVARRFTPGGLPIGGDFLVNAYTTAGQRNVDVDVDADGDFTVVWDSEGQDGSARGIFGRRFASTGVAGPEFRVNAYTTGYQHYASVASDPAGNFVVAWHSGQNAGVSAQRYAGGLMGMELSVDASTSPTSDGNRVLEAGETVAIAPSWLNADFGAQTFSGTASSFTGPGTLGDPIYFISDDSANYGTVASGATASCTADCYAFGITVPSTRPAPHWDATFREEISPAGLGAAKRWTLHVGDSFSDVPRSNGFYRFVETLLHHGVTGGCAATNYCPASSTTREQMAVFALVAREGSGYAPPPCITSAFNDVPASSPFCRWIAELARRGVVGGCGGGNYCPAAAVSRQEMAVFVLATKEPGVTPPACGAPIFSDVPASSSFCRWIEELVRRGVVTGCGAGTYCPAAPVTREQMGVFLSVTFGLLLYGP